MKTTKERAEFILSMTYGQFCRLTELDENNPETFRIWLIALSICLDYKEKKTNELHHQNNSQGTG